MADVEDPLIVDYLTEFRGSVTKYRFFRSKGQRQGQAFFNSLNLVDKGRLSGTPHDPFYKDENIQPAIEFLLFS